jgi:hypothetical protein
VLFLQYNFGGSYDIVKEIQNAGMHAILRIGPYVCAEWTYGYICSAKQRARYIAGYFLFLIFGLCIYIPASWHVAAEAFLLGCVTSLACSSGCTTSPLR